MNKIEYKGYQAEIFFDAEDSVLYGKVLDINDHIVFEIETPENAKQVLKKVIDDYLEMCSDIGKEPDKPYSGVFNVRIPKDLHKRAVQEARKENKTLNKFVESAIQRALDKTAQTAVINYVPLLTRGETNKYYNGALWGEAKSASEINTWKLQ